MTKLSENDRRVLRNLIAIITIGLAIFLLAVLLRPVHAQSIPPNANLWDWTPRPDAKPYQLPMAYQQQMLPPKEFDHEYDGELTIKYLIPQDIRRLCNPALKTKGQNALACTRADFAPKRCTIYMMTAQELERLGWTYDIVLRHETGHCNGWSHSY